jgi:Rps23 Pro-64 3,4-dihydroxylase Tpa1-like proline 4-hydroxylase
MLNNENNSCLIFRDFLDEHVNASLYKHAVSKKEIFNHTQLQGKNGTGVINENWRHSNSLISNDFTEFYKILANKLEPISADIASLLKVPPFEFGNIEMHLTSHNHGEFYKPHIDNGGGQTKQRVITFVYYFHSIPKRFTGGQLLFLHNKPKPLIIEPDNNSIVFFDSSLLHAVHPVLCPDRQFEHGRFTLNGWIRKKIEEIPPQADFQSIATEND